MSDSSLVNRLLQSAEDLLVAKPHSAAYRRRAVSTAYYATFHALAALCVRTLLPKPRSDDEVLRIYRALDHGQLRSAFSQLPLKDHDIFGAIAAAVVQLQQERHRADYLPPKNSLFPLEEAKALLEQSRLVVGRISELSEGDSRMLTTYLLFKERKS